MKMGIKQDTLEIVVRAFKATIGVLGERNGARIFSYLTERLEPTLSVKTKYGSIFFYCPGEGPLFRAETMLTKEPETIEWIDSFEEPSVFWDIGANIGIYSLYAALKPDVKVLAFEPSAFNYHILNRNMCDTIVGGALSSFAEAMDWQGEHFSAKYKQGMLGFSVDDFIERFSPSFPNYIKIDVDGIEGKIINGAEKVISDERLRGLLVELDESREEYCQRVFQILKNGGMKLAAKEHSPSFDKGKFASVYNHIFVRE
jgi:FkbM family methyltransferase